ncbi:MAG: ATP cone domain-containing protein [Candidatus Dependentiae bacterium]
MKKSTGEFENFDREKLKRSLIASGASDELANKIVEDIEINLANFTTTEDIFQYILDHLQKESSVLAARYNLKKALLQFGPTGFPFEKFVAEIFKEVKYEIQLNRIVAGWCVEHEVDIILKKNDEFSLVECKFHNEQRYRVHVQVALYTDARFHDIEKKWKSENEEVKLTHPWIITNTKFTYESLKYGSCKQMKLVSWNYPKEKSLARLIDNYGLYPITTLISLTLKQKKFLIEHGFVLCKDVKKNITLLKSAGIKGDNLNQIIKECELICDIKKTPIDL